MCASPAAWQHVPKLNIPKVLILSSTKPPRFSDNAAMAQAAQAMQYNGEAL